MAVVQWFFPWNVLKLQRLWGYVGMMGKYGGYLQGLKHVETSEFQVQGTEESISYRCSWV
jgi:hypothetical protein